MTGGERAEKAQVVRRQFSEAKGEVPRVTCECGLRAPVRFLYRCYYCGEWYCLQCASHHFGRMREARVELEEETQ